jgi:neutral trehalase
MKVATNKFINFREDYQLAEHLSESEKEDLYFNLKSGAESGWDFSSRWFMAPEGVKGKICSSQWIFFYHK